MVRRDDQHAIPIALLDRDLLAQGLDEVVTALRRKTTELDRGAVALNGLHAQRLLLGEDGLEAVEIGLTLDIVVRIALALDEGAGFAPVPNERTGTHDVLLIPMDILVEDRLGIDEVVGVRERRNEGAGRILQLEHDGVVVGRAHAGDRHVECLTRAGHAFRREDDLVVGRHHVFRGERRAIAELDAITELERIGLAAVGRLRHFGAKIADELAVVRHRRVDPDQQAVERCNRMDERESGFAMAVEARRFGRHDVFQDSAFGRSGRGRGPGVGDGNSGGCRQHQSRSDQSSKLHSLPSLILF